MMFIEDPDEDVEEEEEFHEVEEEKHKTSQESVGSGEKNSSPARGKPLSSPSNSSNLESNDSAVQANSEDKQSTGNETNEKSIETSNDASLVETSEAVVEHQHTTHQTDEKPAQTNDESDLKTDKPVETNVTMLESNDQPVGLNVTPAESCHASTESNYDTNSSSTDASSPLVDDDPDQTDDAQGTGLIDEKAPLEPPVTTTGNQIAEPDSVQIEATSFSTGSSDAPNEPNEPNETPVSVGLEKQPSADIQSSNKQPDWTDIMLSKDTSNGDPAEAKLSEEVTTLESNESKKTSSGDLDKNELDLDEDVKNPQYIPKKGVFYEHDDRSHDVDNKKQVSTALKKEEDSCEVKEQSSGNKKVNPQDKSGETRNRNFRKQRAETDRWNHDLFRDERQRPKSKTELITTYGYDIRQERPAHNQTDSRPPKGVITNASGGERQPPTSQENNRSRTSRENRVSRQANPSNRSRDRRSRRPNNRNRSDTSGTPSKRDTNATTRLAKIDPKDTKAGDPAEPRQQNFHNSLNQAPSHQPIRRDQQDVPRERTHRNDSRGRMNNSKDRTPSNLNDDKLPPINTVMPPITTWSNKIEDMVKEEASCREPTVRNQQAHQTYNQHLNNNLKSRSGEYWPQNNKGAYHDRNTYRNVDESKHQQHYNTRRFLDRDEVHKNSTYASRNNYGDRPNQHHQDWRRTNQYNSYSKQNDFEPIKTQTFENSRLSQSNVNRSNQRDAREIINERRMQSQTNLHSKAQGNTVGTEQQRQQMQPSNQHPHPQLVQQPQHQHHQSLMQHHQLLQQLTQQHARPPHHQHPPPAHQQPQQQHHLHHHQHQHQQPQQPQQHPQPQQHSQPQQPQQTQTQTAQQVSSSRQHHQQVASPQQSQHHQQVASPQQQSQHQAQPRQNMMMNSGTQDGLSEAARLAAPASNTTSTDIMNSRPIIKTDAYTGPNVSTHALHSQSHRSLGGPASQQGPSTSNTHLVPSHLSAGGAQAQYYAPSGTTRDSAAAAAALANAYHGYIPSSHTVMDTARYHMASQQLPDHGYLTAAGQTTDVAAATVLHQPGLYPDATSAGGTVASSAYMAPNGSTLSPSTNIPVTGTGPPPMAPVSYMQHSQYAPPPYSNPYSQPQPNQAPPQSSHAYPYWTYI